MSETKKKKNKKAKDGEPAAKKGANRDGGPSVATHPKAARQVRRAKGWGGLCGFLLASYLSYRAGIPPEQIGIRALAAGVAGYLIAWACSVTVWRQLVLAELQALREQAEAARAARMVQAKAQPENAAEAG